MKKEETPLDYFLRMLIEKKLNFTDLVERYVYYLKTEEREHKRDIIESGFIISMYQNPKINLGTKEQLEDRAKKAIIRSGIYGGTPYEKTLLLKVIKKGQL